MANALVEQMQCISELDKWVDHFRPYDLSLLLIGTTGDGKSSFANFILDTAVFPVGDGPRSVTVKARCLIQKVLNTSLMIIDCPGFMDNVLGDGKVFDEICKINLWASQGIDAIAIVIDPFSRMNPELIKHLKYLEKLGGDLWKHAFIIFPKEQIMVEKLTNKSETGRDYINNVMSDFPDDLLSIYSKVSGRFVCVESKINMVTNDYNTNKKMEILKMIKLINDNAHEFKNYTNRMSQLGIISLEKLCELKKEKYILKKHIELQKTKIKSLFEQAKNYREKCDTLTEEISINEKKMKDMEVAYVLEINTYKEKLKTAAIKSGCTII